MSAQDPGHPLDGITVLERGWLSSNNILLREQPGDDDAMPGGPGATLIDSGHTAHAGQTAALVRHALGGQPLARVINTHLHSDHCGGNATLQREWGATVLIPPWQRNAVDTWDEDVLSYRPTGQRCERFSAHGCVEPGQRMRLAGRVWEVIGAPGHDPDSVMLFDSTHGVLLSADALWENGFGVVFPELEGAAAFDDVAATLDVIERLPVTLVVPGHGAPFADVRGALERARRRLQSFRDDPARHYRHAAKVLVKYHLLEEGKQSIDDMRRWADGLRLVDAVRAAEAPHLDANAWLDEVLGQLVASGAATIRDGVVSNE